MLNTKFWVLLSWTIFEGMTLSLSINNVQHIKKVYLTLVIGFA